MRHTGKQQSHERHFWKRKLRGGYSKTKLEANTGPHSEAQAKPEETSIVESTTPVSHNLTLHIEQHDDGKRTWQEALDTIGEWRTNGNRIFNVRPYLTRLVVILSGWQSRPDAPEAPGWQ